MNLATQHNKTSWDQWNPKKAIESSLATNRVTYAPLAVPEEVAVRILSLIAWPIQCTQQPYEPTKIWSFFKRFRHVDRQYEQLSN